MSLHEYDANLKNARFQLVPKKISEQTFWSNYLQKVFDILQKHNLPIPSEESVEAVNEIKETEQTARQDETKQEDSSAEEWIDEISKSLEKITEGKEKVELVFENNDAALDKDVDTSSWEKELEKELEEFTSN